jgi:GT2 family glycosyltransferase
MVSDPVFGEAGGIQLVTAMIRRNVLEELGGSDPTYRYAEDRDLLVRMREHGVEFRVRCFPTSSSTSASTART